MTRGLQVLGATIVLVALLLTWLILAAPAQAGGGNYRFDGGGPRARAQVRAALDASSFPWNVVPVPVTIHLEAGARPSALPGHIWLDPYVVRTGRWAWGIVQHEYAHQVAYFLPGRVERRVLTVLLGGRGWCHETAGLDHHDQACERFASGLAYAYWPSRQNIARHGLRHTLGPRQFHQVVRNVLGVEAPTPVVVP